MNTKSPGQVNEIDWLTPRTREILLLAQQEAGQAGRPSIQPEHLLLGVILQAESKAATLLNNNGLDVGTLRAHTQGGTAGHLSSTEPLPPLSQAAEECIERAIAMIAYYLTRNRLLAKVTPEHLVLSVISHPSAQKFLVSYPALIASLRQQLTEDMEPAFLKHIEDLFLHPDRLQDAGRSTLKVSSRNREHVWKIRSVATFRCPSCQQQIPLDWKHCTYCGKKVAKKCATCGTPSPNVKGAKFCIECGSRLD
jgi:hypothetical protein